MAGPTGGVAALRVRPGPVGGLEDGGDLICPLEQAQGFRGIDALLLGIMRRPLPPSDRLVSISETLS